MTDAKDAIANLKAKLAEMGKATTKASESMVALANYTAGSVTTKYVGGNNLDWNPEDHPRDPNTGEFMKTPSGYLWGKSKKADFNAAAPLFLNKITLKPGDVAFKTNAGNVLVSHADNSYSLHQPSGSVKEIPGGADNTEVTKQASKGLLKKIGENPGIAIQTNAGLDKAKDMLAEPSSFVKTPTGIAVKKHSLAGKLLSAESDKVEAPKGAPNATLTTPPALKPGKNAYTAKQVTDYQTENLGKVLTLGSDGVPITSGSWVYYEGKPYLVHASIYGDDKKTAYRWVSTKQQASNLPKEDVFPSNTELSKAKAIADPTGKPYGTEGPTPASDAMATLKSGSIMSQAVTGNVPNAAVAHKIFVEKAVGSPLSINVQHEGNLHPLILTDAKHQPIVSGDWVEIEGKPFQVHKSPNEGNIAMAKWVSTKQKKSNNTYDFPASVLGSAVKIEDPTGKDYTPLPSVETAEKPKPLTEVLDKYKTAELIMGDDAADPWAIEEKVAVKEPLVSDVDLSTSKTWVGTNANGTQVKYVNKGLWDGWKATDSNGSVEEGLSDGAVLSDTKNFETFEPASDVSALEAPLAEWEKELLEGAAYEAPKKPALNVLFSMEMLVGAKYSKMSDGKWHYGSGLEGATSDALNDVLEENFQKQAAIEVLMNSAQPGDKFYSEQLGTGKIISLTVADDLAFIQEFTKLPLDKAKLYDNLYKPVGFKSKVWKESAADQKKAAFQNKIDDSPKNSVLTSENKNYTKQSNGLWYSETSGLSFTSESMLEGTKPSEWALTLPDKIIDEPAPKGHKNVFVHPVSGVTMDLAAGDKVYKHKKTPNVFIVVKAEGENPVNFFTQMGKQHKPKASHKNFDNTYVEESNWPGEHAEDMPIYAGTLLTTDLFKNAVAGDSIEMSSGVIYTKSEGFWEATNSISSKMSEVSMASILNVYAGVNWSEAKFLPSKDKQKPKPALKDGDVLSQSDFDALPEGTTVFAQTKFGDSQWTKNGDGLWAHYKSKTLQASNIFSGWVSEGWLKYGALPSKDSTDSVTSVSVGPVTETQQTPAVKVGFDKKSSIYTFPNGSTAVLASGDALVEFEHGGSMQVMHASGLGKPNVFYTPQGDLSGLNWALHSNLANVKKAKKNSAFQVLAEKKLLTAAKSDTPPDTGEAKDLDSYSAINSYEATRRSIFKKIIPTSYGSVSYYGEVGTSGKQWTSMDAQEKLLAIAAYEPAALDAYATFNKALSDVSSLDKAQKADVTKMKNRTTLIWRMSRLAAELANPESAWSDEKFVEELAFVSSKAVKPGTSLGAVWKYSLPIEDLAPALSEGYEQRKFKQTLEGFDFDPYNATTAQYDAYAKSQGINHLAALSLPEQKMWMLAQLGDPTLSPGQITTVNKALDQAKTKIVVAGLAAQFEKVVSEAKPKILKGVTDKLALAQSYTWGDSGAHVSFVSDDTWELEAEDGGLTQVTDAIVVALINNFLANGAEVQASDTPAYGNDDVISALQVLGEKHGIGDWSSASILEIRNVVVTEGGQYVEIMGFSSMRSWLFAHVTGDQVAKFHIEQGASPSGVHVDTATHPGSPSSPVGKVAHQALLQKLSSSPFGQAYLDGTLKTHDLDASVMNFSDGFESGYVGLFASQVGSPAAYYQHWVKGHPKNVLKNFSLDKTSGSAEAVQPSSVPDDVWLLVSNLSATTNLTELITPAFLNMPDAEAEAQMLKTVSGTDIQTFSSGLPVYVKRTFLWANAVRGSDLTAQAVYSSLFAKIKAGEYLDDQTPVWLSPSGAKFPISPGGKVYEISGHYGNSYMLTGPPNSLGVPTSGIVIDKHNNASNASAYVLPNLASDTDYKLLFTMPNPVKWDSAKAENLAFEKSMWDIVQQVEEGKTSAFSHYQTGSELTALLKNNKVLEENYPHVYAQHKSLPENVRQAVLDALESPGSGPAFLSIVEYKAAKNHYASIQAKGLHDPGAPWLPNLSLAQVSAEDVNVHWSPGAKSAYMEQFNLSDPSQIAPHLDLLINPQVDMPTKMLPKFDDLVLTATSKNPGGMHSKNVWFDQDGNEWMSKAFNSDPNAKARVDAETAAIRIGHIFKFRSPAATAKTVGGKYAYLQHLAPADGDLSGKGVKDLTTKQLQQAMEEHVLDWIVSNHDTHSQNLMIDTSGNVFGIDKGQAFKHFPNDKLAIGYLPPENGASVWYDQFYKGIQSGSVSKEQADEVVKHVLRRAQKISKDQDAEYKSELDFALKNRDFWPNEYPSREKFIDALMERKHNAFEDFVSFYKSVYASAPYDFDIDTENLVPPMLDEHTHISVSSELAEDIVSAGVHGKALFFESSDIDDSHIMFSKVVGSDGKQMLTGEAKIRKNGDALLTNWLQKQTIENQSGYQTQSYDDTPDDEEIDLSELHQVLPNNSNWFNSLKQGSITVSSHNKNGNSEYNQSTLSNMESTKQQIETVKNSLANWESSNPTKPWQATELGYDFKTLEQQNAFKKMLDTYLDYYAQVISKKGTSEKISPHFEQYTYTPSAKANKEYDLILNPPSNAPGTVVTIQFPSHKVEWTYQDDGSLVMTSNEQKPENVGVVVHTANVKSTLTDWKNVTDATITIKEAEPSEVPEEDVESSVSVQVGTKVLKVVHRKAASQKATFKDDGELYMSGSEWSKFDTGNMYEIDFGNTVIEYRSHKGSNVGVAQQGLLKFRKKDWKGDSDSIDDVLDVLRHMGLDLTPATEESMEIHYWKHMAGVLRNRKDRSNSPWKGVLSHIDDALKSNSSMSATEELAMFREAWTMAYGADVVNNAKWMPQFSRNRPHVLGEKDTFTAGKPYWTRPDLDYAALRKIMNGRAPASSLKGTGDALKIVKSGAGLSSEERYRILSAGFKEGWSSGADVGHGSSGGVFIRQNMELGWTGGYSEQAYYHPKVIFRTQNYSFDGDNYGEVSNQSSNCSFDWKQSAGIYSGSNETMIKDALSVLDDILFLRFYSEDDRAEAIKRYKDLGVDTLHGFPIEDLFVTQLNVSKMKKVYDAVWDQMEKEQKEAAK